MKTFFHSIFAGLLACSALAAADSVALTLPDKVTCSVAGQSPCDPANQIITQRIDTVSIGLLPAGGYVHGPAGSLAGWGFTLTWNTNSGDWLRVTNSSASRVSVNNAGYFDIIGFIGGPTFPQNAVTPNSQWTENFNPPTLQGAGGVTLLADCSTAPAGTPCADQGSTDSGNIIFIVAVYDGDPTAGGNLLGSFTYGNCTSSDPSVCAQSSTAYAAAIDYASPSDPPVISFAGIGDQLIGAPPVALSATAPVAIPILFTSLTPPVCSVSGTSATLLATGSCSISASQNGNFQYGSALPTVQSFNVNRNQATITFDPASLTQNYSGSGITASFTTSPANLSTTVLYDGSASAPSAAGPHTVQVTITDPAYQGTATSVLTINPIQPVVTWNTPAAITYGTPLSATQFNASANVAGTFAYGAAVGTVLSAGSSQTLSATFTPTDALDYSLATATTTIDVNKATPTITWPALAAIAYGSALSSSQLNATASTPGTFAYTPAAGTVLPIGSGQTLSVTFTPTDATDYIAATGSTTISVNASSPPASAAHLVLTYALSRINGNVVVAVTLANTGGTAAANVMLTTAKIGTPSATPLPQNLGSIAAGSSSTATVSVPGTVGASGAASSISIGGTYTGGTFSSAARVTLP